MNFEERIAVFNDFSLRELSKIVFSAIIGDSQRLKGRILRGGMKIGNRGRESTERNDHL